MLRADEENQLFGTVREVLSTNGENITMVNLTDETKDEHVELCVPLHLP